MSIHSEPIRKPDAHGQLLLRPDARQLAPHIAANRRRLAASSLTILGQPLPRLRQTAKAEIVTAARNYTQDLGFPVRPAHDAIAAPLILTGHQCELYHCGIWVKNILAHRISQALGGTAINLAVDNDMAKSLALHLPERVNDEWQIRSLPFAQAKPNQPTQFVPPPDADFFQRFHEQATDLAQGQPWAPGLDRLLRAMAAAQPRAGSLADWLIRSRYAIEYDLGLRHLELPVSIMCRATGWLTFVADIIANLDRFAAAHNNALAHYRATNRIRNAANPVPDLAADNHAQELPFWGYLPNQPRAPLMLTREADQLALMLNGRRVARLSRDSLTDADAAARALAQALADAGLALRPRALTLTLFARLLVADTFIHGIGGAVYDHVTDDIIRRYYAIEPPTYVCTSATMHLPLPIPTVSERDVASARHRARDAVYNPQRHLPPQRLDQPGARDLAQQRTTAIAESRDLRNAAHDSPAQHRASFRHRRRDVFNRIRRINADLLSLDPLLLPKLQEAASRAAAKFDQTRVARFREFCFVLFDEREIDRLMQAVPSVEELRSSA